MMENTALIYAEKHGICEYHVVGNEMIYYSSFPMEKSTYKCVVNLENLTEIREKMNCYYRSYKDLIDGKFQSNYMV